MWGLETIKQINKEAAEAARKREAAPHLVVEASSLKEWPPFPFPHLGYACDDVDKTHSRLKTFFVDSSGLGGPGEPALTTDAFKKALAELLEAEGPLLLALEEVGQFQVYVAVWRANGV